MPEHLKRRLGLLEVFCVASGAMISSGLFILPGLAYAKAGPAVIFSYLVAGFMLIPAVLSKAELTSAMPRAGGDYFYIARSMGGAMGTLGGIASWFSLSFKSAFALVGMGAYTAYILDLPIKYIALFFCIVFTIINILGIKQAGITQVFLVLGLIALLLFFVFRGAVSVDVHRFVPFAPGGFASVFGVAGFVFISYGGLTKIASIAEEIKNPGRNIPLGMLLSLIVIGTLYVLVIFVTVGVLPGERLADTLTPISDAAGVFAGKAGEILLAVAALLAFVSTANAGLMSASRYPIAMSRDGILPGLFQATTRRSRTPWISILFTAGFMIAIILFLSLEILVEVASILLLLMFFLANLSVVFMRASRIHSYRPSFRAPLFPWLQIAGMIFCAALIAGMGGEALLITIAFLVAGLIWYLLYARHRFKRESAIVHIAENVMARELVSTRLEDELKEIVFERDNIVEDRFDRLISNCVILDIEGSPTLEEFLQNVASKLSDRLGCSEEKIFSLLVERERESTTAISPGIAIPHIIVEEEGRFEMLVARCKEGIIFNKDQPPVHTVFVLAGSRSERNFHLRALMAIAQITQSHRFTSHWMSARGVDTLRNILLMASRRRL